MQSWTTPTYDTDVKYDEILCVFLSFICLFDLFAIANVLQLPHLTLTLLHFFFSTQILNSRYLHVHHNGHDSKKLLVHGMVQRHWLRHWLFFPIKRTIELDGSDCNHERCHLQAWYWWSWIKCKSSTLAKTLYGIKYSWNFWSIFNYWFSWWFFFSICSLHAYAYHHVHGHVREGISSSWNYENDGFKNVGVLDCHVRSFVMFLVAVVYWTSLFSRAQSFFFLFFFPPFFLPLSILLISQVPVVSRRVHAPRCCLLDFWCCC